MTDAAEEFRRYLETAARRFPTKQALARAIGITPGRLSRVLSGEHSLDVVNCLRLAHLTGDAPGEVLRIAGKGDVATLIEGFYGRAAPAMPPADRDLLDKWHLLTVRQREVVLEVITLMVVTYYGGPRVQSAPIDVSKLAEAIDTSAHGRAARRDAAHGQDFGERPLPVAKDVDAQPTPVSRAQRARASKEAAAIDRLTRAAEQADAVGRSASTPRIPRQHAAAPGAIAPARRARAGKHRR